MRADVTLLDWERLTTSFVANSYRPSFSLSALKILEEELFLTLQEPRESASHKIRFVHFTRAHTLVHRVRTRARTRARAGNVRGVITRKSPMGRFR